jgi:ATP/maltotriose-dependent transcriptional regulator MalT
VCDVAIEQGQRTGSPNIVASFLFPRAFARLGRGALADAEADARWSFDLKRAMGPDGAYAWPLAFLVGALVERGDLAAARAALAVCPDDPLPETMAWALVIQSRGRLHLAAGDPPAAVGDLRDAAARFERLACRGPGLAWWQTDLAIALARVGNLDEARRVAEEFAGLARATGVDRFLSVAARTLAAVSRPDQRELLLREAVTRAADAPLDRAHALVELGAHLRRTGHRGSARDPLRLGLDLAHRLGAAPLATRAREELVAAGGRPRRPAVSGVDALTASERRVVALATEGLSNREIAERLFVTQRTVETHLGHAFAKLGVRRRDQLTLG